MFASAYRRGIPALALVAGLAGCAGQQAAPGGLTPQAAGRVPLQISAKSTQFGVSNYGKSWMKPELISRSLLYVSDTSAHYVEVYTYPGLKFVGRLTGFVYPAGECVDKAGNVWITDAGSAAVYEYAHGGTSPIETITDGMYIPSGCAIDPKTGDLAVANGNVQVLIFPGASGSPIAYRDFNFSQTTSLSYDRSDNLFVDGLDGSGVFHYAELPAGAEVLTDITLNGFPYGTNSPGGVRWDGNYITVSDSQHTLYRTQGANIVSTTSLSATCVFGFYIAPSRADVIAPDQCSKNLVGVYPYPAGGSPIKTIGSGLATPYDAVLSR
jgi:hypothetical protein